MRSSERRSATAGTSLMDVVAPLFPFVDLNFHVLPRTDFTVSSLAAAVELCVQASHHGVAYAMATPHYRSKPYAGRAERLGARLLKLREALIDRGVPLELALAGECRFDAALHHAIAAGTLPILGHWEGEQVVLIDFSEVRVPAQFDRALEWMRARKIRPMLAHPERNREVQERPDRLAPLIDIGLLLQLDADALAGGRGPFAQEAALRLLRNGWVTVLASNGHDPVQQPPLVEPGRMVAAQVLGEAESWQLVSQRPARIAATHFPMLAKP